MKRNLLRAFALLLMAVILTTAFVCNATYAKAAEGDPFKVGETSYATLTAAVDAAAVAEDKTVTMTAGADLSGQGTQLLHSGVTLDLAGFELTVDAFSGDVNGVHLIDSSEKKTGLLVTSGKVQLDRDNAMLPVYNGTGYMLLEPKMNSSYQKFVPQTDGDYYFAFRPGFGFVKGDSTNGESVASTYLAKGNSRLQMRFTVYTLETGYASDDANGNEYYFDDAAFDCDVFQHVYSTDENGKTKMFFCKLKNVDEVAQLRVKTTIVSDTGVYYTGESTTGKATMLDMDRIDVDESGSLPTYDEDNVLVNTLPVSNTGVTYIKGDNGAYLKFSGSSVSDGSYQDLPVAPVITLDVKFSDLTASSTSSKSFEIYYGSNATDFGSNYRVNFVRLRGDGSLYVFGTDGTVDESTGSLTAKSIKPAVLTAGATLRLRLTIDTTKVTKTSPYGMCYVYCVLTDAEGVETSAIDSIALSAPILNTNIRFQNRDTVNISELRLKADVNAKFGDVLKDEKVDKTVTWTWEDGNNADKLQPKEIKVEVYKKVGEAEDYVTEATVAASLGTYTFKGLPAYDADGKEITYTFKTKVDHYKTTVNGEEITLIHTPQEITYYYNNDFNNTELTGGGTTTNIQITDATSGNALVDQLGVFVTQEDTTTGNKYLELKGGGSSSVAYIGNLGTSYSISFKVRLKASINATVRMYGDGGTAIFAYITGNTISTNSTNTADNVSVTLSDTTWTDVCFTFEGGEVTCEIGDAAPVTFDYTLTKSQFIIKNRKSAQSFSGLYIDDLKVYAPYEGATVAGSINWNDGENADKVRPEELTVKLFNGSIQVDEATVNTDNWTYSFTDLPKINTTESFNNKEYTYRVEVAEPEGYTMSTDGYDITLTRVPKYLYKNDFANKALTGTIGSITSGANYELNGEYLAVRPTHQNMFIAYITEAATPAVNMSFKVRLETAETSMPTAFLRFDGSSRADLLYFEGQQVYARGNADKAMTLTANEWVTVNLFIDSVGNTMTATLTNEAGETIEVTTGIADRAFNRINLYTAGSSADYTSGLCFDDLVIEKALGAKTTIYKEYAVTEGQEPASVTVTLKKDGDVEATAEATAETGWRYTFENLDLYKADGTAHVYTVETVENPAAEEVANF